MEELKRLWTEDMRKLKPDFELFDKHRMAAAIQLAAETCRMTDCHEIEIIAWVLRNLSETDPAFGIPGHWWWLCAARIMMPEIEPHNWLQLLFQIAYESRGKRQLHTIWGAASTSKSQSFAVIGLTESVIWAGAAYVFITSPFKTAGEDKIFRAFKKYTDRWAVKPPHWMRALKLTCVSNRSEIIFSDENQKTSRINFVSLENPSSVVGKKSEAAGFHTDGDPDSEQEEHFSVMDGDEISVKELMERSKRLSLVGRVLLIGDELFHNPNACQNLLTAEGNLVSNANVLTLVGGNPISDQVSHPMALELSKPSEVGIESLDEKRDYTWKTARGQLFRLAMDVSPNRHAILAIFPYLINFEQAHAQKLRGESIEMAQTLAWGWSSGYGNGGVLTETAIRFPAWQDTPIWKSAQKRWMAVDLAFGGDDPAGYTVLESGICQVVGEDGNSRDEEVISGVEQGLLNVERTWKPTFADIEEFRRLALERGGVAPNLTAGKEYRGGDYHMVLQMLRAAKQLGVPKGMVTFDSSLRADVTLIARQALGHTAWFYDGQRQLKVEEEQWSLWPPEILPTGERKKWSDCHRRLISAIWRFSEHVISRGHVRNLSKLQKGCFELISRRWKQATDGTKVDVEGKKELLGDRTRNLKSPVWGETLAIAIMFGVRFCNALPNLSKEKPVVQGRSMGFTDHKVFKIRSRNISPALWR